MRCRCVIGVFLLAGVMSLSSTAAAWAVPDAVWHAGNYRNNKYGVKADIRTPPSRPILYFQLPHSQNPYDRASAVTGHVSTGTGGLTWVQAGWVMYYGWLYANSYIEYKPFMGNGQITYIDALAWYTPVTYSVAWGGANGMWNVNIAGQDKGFFGPAYNAPDNMEAMGEIQGNPANQFFSGMNNVKHRNSGTYDWQLFNENHMSKDNPPNPISWYYYYPYKYSLHANGM